MINLIKLFASFQKLLSQTEAISYIECQANSQALKFLINLDETKPVDCVIDDHCSFGCFGHYLDWPCKFFSFLPMLKIRAFNKKMATLINQKVFRLRNVGLKVGRLISFIISAWLIFFDLGLHINHFDGHYIQFNSTSMPRRIADEQYKIKNIKTQKIIRELRKPKPQKRQGSPLAANLALNCSSYNPFKETSFVYTPSRNAQTSNISEVKKETVKKTEKLKVKTQEKNEEDLKDPTWVQGENDRSEDYEESSQVSDEFDSDFDQYVQKEKDRKTRKRRVRPKEKKLMVKNQKFQQIGRKRGRPARKGQTQQPIAEQKLKVSAQERSESDQKQIGQYLDIGNKQQQFAGTKNNKSMARVFEGESNLMKPIHYEDCMLDLENCGAANNQEIFEGNI